MAEAAPPTPWLRLRAAATRRRALLLIAAVAGLAAAQVVSFHDLRHDDAYITYRYGQNLASGLGLVFNPGERLMGSTSPGQSLLAALLFPATGEDGLPTAMTVIGCLGWIAQALAGWWLLRRALGEGSALLVGLVLALGAAGSSGWVAIETNITAAFALWAVAVGLGGRWSLAAVLSALAVLFRPDALIVPALLFIPCVRQVGARAWRPALIFLVLSAPWFVFAQLYFGTVVPLTASAKIGLSGIGEYALHVLRHPAKVAFPFVPTPLAAVPCWGLAVLGAVRLIRLERKLWVLPAWGFGHLAAYLALHPYHEHVWHLYPGVLVLAILVVAGLVQLWRWPRSRPLRAALGALLLAFVLLHGMRFAQHAITHASEPWSGARDAAYRQVAAYLDEHAAAGDRVAAVEVGTIGYHTGLPMFDYAALITPLGTALPPDVRFIVLDPQYLALAGRLRPVAVFSPGAFTAVVYDVRRPGGDPDVLAKP